MTIVLAVVAGILILIAVAIVVLFLFTKLMDRPLIRRLKKYSVERLEKTVYRYEPEYFKFIGEENEVVREFRKVIENKDIATLHKKWGSFSEKFMALESKAGYKDRPLILDYYAGYELEVRELYKRKRAEL